MKNLKIKRMIFLILLTSLISFGAGASAVQDRRNGLIKVINQELSEVIRLTKQTRGRNPNLILRMAELHFEKARLIKEGENEIYMRVSPEKRRNSSKNKYFKGSRKHFQKAQTAARYLLKKYKNFKGKSDVFYIMAFNAKEFGDQKKADAYLRMSVKHGKGKSFRSGKSYLALGDSYYNKQNYRKAAPYYQKGLKLSPSDSWWTKYAYNLSWCYTRLKKFDSAISLMKKIHRLSKNKKYIDMSYQVERDLAYFYTLANRTNEAVGFYKKIGARISHYFLKVSKYLIKQGKETSAEETLKKVLENNPNAKEEIDTNNHLLEIYEKYARHTSHYKVSKRVFSTFKKGQLKSQYLENFKYQLQAVSSAIQKNIVNKKYDKNKSLKDRKINQTVHYFEMLRDVDPDKIHQWNFHAGETLYAGKKFKRSLEYYDSAHKGALSKGDKKIANNSLDGLLSSLSKSKFKKSAKDKYVVYSYKAYIRLHPRTKKSNKIHQRLFNFYYNKNNIPAAESTIFLFKKNFPNDHKTQEIMLAKVMDHHKNKKDRGQIVNWVSRINKGEFKVSKKYADSLRKLLLSMKFEKVEKANKKGNKKEALLGYVEIYNKSEKDKIAKKNAAYNISVILYEVGETERNYFWALKSLKLLSPREIVKFQDSFILMAGELFNRGKFTKSVDLYSIIYAKLCSTKSKNKHSIYKNTYVIALANNQVNKAQSIIDSGRKCKIRTSYINDGNLELLKEYSKKNNWGKFNKKYSSLKKVKKIMPQLIELLNTFYIKFKSNGRTAEANSIKKKMLGLYQKSLRSRLDIPLESLDIIATFKVEDLNKDVSKFKQIKLRFPEKTFNNLLKLKFKKLDRITAKALNIMKTRSGEGIVNSYRILSGVYSDFVKEIRSFRPTGKSKGYVNSFVKGMSSMTIPISKKASEFLEDGIQTIRKEKILSKENQYFLSKVKLPFSIEYKYYMDGVIMDRSGNR